MAKQTAGRDNLGKLAPEFARYNDDVLFGEVWSREAQLSLRDRSLVTIAALIGAKNFPQVKAHLAMGKAHGITRDEAVEIVTQLAFYTGWPSAWTVFPMIGEIYGDDTISGHGGGFGLGESNTAFAQYFTGQSYLNMLAVEKTAGASVANITFEPGCRNNWHIHHAKSGGGQILVCVDGKGWYQAAGEEPVAMTKGSVVIIPAEVKHWHGAAKDSWFSHLAIEVPGTETSNEWLEPVSD